MKIRTDFVTNSSSSSFILAHESELNQKQKDAIIQYVENVMLGKVLLTPESTEEEIKKVFEDDWSFHDEKIQENIREALKNGKSVYDGYVSFEETDYLYGEIFQDIWKLLEENGDGNFITIDGDLSY